MFVPSKPLVEASYRIRTWYEEPPAGVPYEHVLQPEYWVHRTRQVRPGDQVQVYAADGSYFGRLMVRRVDGHDVRVASLEYHDFGGKVEPAAPGFEVRWGSPSVRFRVHRLSDGMVMKDGFDTKEDALAWIKRDLKATAA